MRDDEGGRQRDMFHGQFEEPTLRVFVALYHIYARQGSRGFICIAIFVHTYHFLPGTDTLSFCNSPRTWVFKDAAFLDVECVCFDQSVTRG